MTLRAKYILFITLIHITALVMSFFVFNEQKLVFIASEIIIIFSLFFAARLYRSMVHPLQLILQGTESMADRDFSVKFQRIGQYETDKLIDVYNGMIDQLRVERTFKEQQHYFLEKLIHTSPTGIIILDLEEKISTVNPKASTLLDIAASELLGNFLMDFEYPLLKAIASLPQDVTETIQINGVATYKCHKAHFIDRGFPNYFILIEELTAEKLAIEKQAYGKVIRMMAHEVNNSIGPINSIIDSILVYKEYLPSEEKKEFVHAIQVAFDRNLKLNQFMQNFASVARLPLPEKSREDLRPIIENIGVLLGHKIPPKEIQIENILPSTPYWVEIDVQQFEQVLINVLLNSIEAIPRKGVIRVELRSKPQELVIIDNGKGIPADHSAQIFTPFFSTKQHGQGVGLTLVRDILSNHGFAFSLQSNEGETRFTVSF